MAKKTSGKAQIIREYLKKNPTHTWKDAEPTLKKKGISSAYFAMTKSQSKNKKPTIGKNVPDAVAFARACGGIDKAIAKLQELKAVQV